MTGKLFHIVDDAYAILRRKGGVYVQAKVFCRGANLYAGVSGGFVMLFQNGTSSPNISVVDIFMSDGHRVTYDKTGRACLPALDTSRQDA